MKKSCAICGEDVLAGQGIYYMRRLIHKKCYGVAKIQSYRLGMGWAFGRKRRAVAYEIVMVVVTLSVSALIYMVVDAIVSAMYAFQQTYYPTSVGFQTNYLSFIMQYWYWLPIIIIMGLVIWGVVASQRRNPYGG